MKPRVWAQRTAPCKAKQMHLNIDRIIAAAALTLGLAGCEMDPALMGTMPVAQPVAQVAAPVAIDPTRYAAIEDEGKVVPAIPLEHVPVEYQRQVVDYPTDRPAGTIIIDPSTKHLYLVSGNNKALRYGISVGRAGFAWSGEADIVGRTTWPKWIPPHEMIDRRPELEPYRDVGQPGGLTNPLGSRALYLKTDGVDYGYRIHGTPEWESIGHNASSGCIRMINQDVMDLYNRVPDGTRVVVLTEDGQFPTGLNVPPKVPAKKPKPVASAPALVDVSAPADVTDTVTSGGHHPI
jgi:lipoprotein-anchoring transpeptidase ErfK/SrfK